MIHVLVTVMKGDERYLEPVLDHASRWADYLYCALEPGASTVLPEKWADAYGELRISFSENDGMAKSRAWLDLTHAAHPNENDHIAVIKSTEIFQNPDAIKKAVKEYPGYAMKAKVHHMWDASMVRVDGQWEPKEEIFMVPWTRGASYPDFRLRAGRLPSYHYNVTELGVSVSDVLDYDMRTFEDKLRKWDWFQSVDAEGFYSHDHIASIKRQPTLMAWQNGGVLHDRQTV